MTNVKRLQKLRRVYDLLEEASELLFEIGRPSEMLYELIEETDLDIREIEANLEQI